MIDNDIYDTVPKLDGSYPTSHIEKCQKWCITSSLQNIGPDSSCSYEDLTGSVKISTYGTHQSYMCLFHVT